MAMTGGKDLPVVAFPDRAHWANWLEANHESAAGVWLKLAKKGSGHASVSGPEALEIALCYGWIDGQGATLDEAWWLQRYTPRTARSRWSEKNRAAALRLIAAGEMRPAGLAQVRAAQADGRWEAAYASPRNITVPDDLRAALDASPPARKRFEQLDSRNRYAILYRVHDAKRPATRQRRIAKYVAMLEAGETIY
jgi:uncharacterized protein YdeI (YjbR/CyaY-like superfamily)